MGGYDKEVVVMGDWLASSPSPRAFFSSIIANDSIPYSVAYSGNENGTPPGPLYEGEDVSNALKNDPTQARMGSVDADDLSVVGEPKTSSRGCLRDRMAARAGFNAPRLNTENIRPVGISKNPEVRSPYLTIPPGLSPTYLLDSPVFLANSLVVPSPTTGKFPFAPSMSIQNSTMTTTNDPEKGEENAFDDTSSFAFKPIAESRQVPQFDAAYIGQGSGFAPQMFPDVEVSVHVDTSLPSKPVEPLNFQSPVEPLNFQSFVKLQENCGSNLSPEAISISIAENSPPLDEPCEDDGDQTSNGDPNIGGGPAEDGYNWRKYGQKQVKGSEYPRSYYKCTYSNCPVKKKVERSHEGHVTEIIYKGAHSHPKPNQRSYLVSSNGQLECEGGRVATGDLVWGSTEQKGNIVGATGWVQENLEAQEFGNGVSFPVHHEPRGGVEQSRTFSNDEEDDRVTHGSVSLGYDGEEDESESKRRRIETYPSEISGATRAIREPRVVVQTTSDVDILDDGYRWRKYGQKVVKGNPNPRSYYKCTSPGCNVRKHVERASHDLKSVITTYEGKHNHEVPAARNSSSSSHSHSHNHSHVANLGNSNGVLPPQQQLAVSNRGGELMPMQFGRTGLGPLGSRLQQGPGFRFGTNHAGLAMGLGMGQQQGVGVGMGMGMGMNNQSMLYQRQSYVLPKVEPGNGIGTGTERSNNIITSNAASAVYQQLMRQMPRHQPPPPPPPPHM